MPSEPVGEPALARPDSVSLAGRAVHRRAPRLHHRAPVGLLVVGRADHEDLALQAEEPAGEGQRGAPLAGAGLGRQLADARLGVLVGLRDGGVGLVRAGGRDALVLVVDARGRIELGLQAPRAVQRRRAPQLVGLAHRVGDLDLGLGADLLEDERHREDRRRGRRAPRAPSSPGAAAAADRRGGRARRLTQCVGIASSVSRNFVWASAMVGQPYPPPMATRGVDHGPSVEQAVSLYAAGYFPMDDVTEAHNPLPFYAAERRAVLELDEASRAALRRRVRRSLRAGEHEGWRLVRDERFEEVLDACARPREPGDGVWITERLQGLYRRLHEAGLAHSFEIEAGRRAGRRPRRRPARPRGDARVDVPSRARRRQRAAGPHPRRARRARLRPVRHPAPDRAHDAHGRAARGARGLRGAPAQPALS